jgi:hypothetical protein
VSGPGLPRLVAVAATAVLAAVSVARAQTPGQVVVTVPHANIRAEASETSQVLTQVVQGTLLDLIAVEGDWFHVRVPVGSLRVEAYISKKVSKLQDASAKPATTGPPPPAPTAGAPAPHASAPSAAARSGTHDGMSVTLTVGTNSVLLTPSVAQVVQIPQKVDSLAKLVWPEDGFAAPAAGAAPSGSTPVTFVWFADQPADRTIDARRPSFVVVFQDIPGVSPDDLTAMLLRLTPTTTSVELIAAARGRADEATHTDADWDLAHELKQNAVRCKLEVVDRGGLRLTPTGDLAPGDYTIVLRPNGRKKLAGSVVLGSTAEGHVLGQFWPIAVK